MAKAKKSRRKKQKLASSLQVTHITIPTTTLNGSRRRGLAILLFTAIITIMAVSLLHSTYQLSHRAVQTAALSQGSRSNLGVKYHAAHLETVEFIQAQKQAQVQVIGPDRLQEQLTAIRVDINTHRRKTALAKIQTLEEQLHTYHVLLEARMTQRQVSPTPSAPVAAITVPILIYHYTPSDFEAQLATLESKQYTTITLDALDAALHKNEFLPAKPIVITFDDGFANQMTAYELLQRHHMSATYYIINGGERSQWCIGADRRLNDPLQPTEGCGDNYLTWLDRSGLITIGSHTIDHQNLATLSNEDQTYEIVVGKRDLEAQLGHAVRHFAYPYGGYNTTTASIVKSAGFATAVSTIPGSMHSLDTEYSLHRVRDVSSLP